MPFRSRATVPLMLAALTTLAGCVTPPAATAPAPTSHVDVLPDAHVPDFARTPYEPMSRATVVGIALREWRLFDKPVDDDPPGTRPSPQPEEKPERWDGLWQRVGEYWWLGLDAGSPESGWTGKHDANGNEFSAKRDGYYAWSAAFVSYVFRVAGAGNAFPYSAAHSDYIDDAAEQAHDGTHAWVITAERPEIYAPQLGDLICEGRGKSGRLTFDDLPAGHFPSHCDIVVALMPGQISVVGGNVDDAVTMKHVPVTPDGKLATPDGTVLDSRYPWMVVLRVLYPTPISQGPGTTRFSPIPPGTVVVGEDRPPTTLRNCG